MPRLVVAAGLVVWGARSSRRWTVVVATMLAVPHFWFATLGGLVALAAVGFSWSSAVSSTGSALVEVWRNQTGSEPVAANAAPVTLWAKLLPPLR